MHEIPFAFDVAAETFEKSDPGLLESNRNRRIAGFVSTDHMDRQQETLVQEGLDFSYFLEKGWFNDNHLKETGKAVGYPEMADLRPLPNGGGKGWYVEGFLLKGHPPADEIWSFADSLKKSGAPRKIGYSVEGAILLRDANDPRTVLKAMVREVAITRNPVNAHTGLEMLAKSLSAGHGHPAATTGGQPGDGGPMRVQSLEGRGKPKEEEDEDAEKLKKKLRRMKKSEAIEMLMQSDPRVTRNFATRVVEFALRHHAA
jgi:hypothetical protein